MSRSNVWKKTVAGAAALALTMNLCPLSAMADDIDGTEAALVDEELESKLKNTPKCGDNLTWSFSGNTLTITGTGDMYELPVYDTPDSEQCMPWYQYRKQIENVVIEEGVTSIGSCAFYDCTAIKSVSIPSSVRYIGFSAFADCSSLEEVSVQNGIIGESAFIRCTALKKVTIGPGVNNMGISAFENCNALEAVYISDVAAWCGIDFGGYLANPLEKARNLYLNGTLVKSLEIPEGVTKIGNYAFCYCKNITSVTIPASVKHIGEYAFYMDDRLASVYIPSSGLEYVGSCAFSSCSKLSYLNIPSTVSFIGSYGFAYTPIEHVSVEKGYIGDHAFYKCGAIWDVTVGDSVSYIGDYAFSGCAGLNTVNMGYYVSYIGDNAFSDCTKLLSEGHVDFGGTAESWANISIGANNSPLTGTRINYLGRGTASAPAYVPKQEVKFGKYEQDNDLYNGAEDIVWYVLDVQGDKALIVSRDVLDFQRYAPNIEELEITWKDSFLRSWLNYDFYSKAFTAEEQAAIIASSVPGDNNPVYGTKGGETVSDNVFILSASQANTYFRNDAERIAKCTDYAYARNSDPALKHHDFGSSYWWLRTPGLFGYAAMYTHYTGYTVNDGMACANVIGGVRPAVWVDRNAIGVKEENVSEFVDRLYSIILDRPAEDTGLADWTNRLKSGKATSAEIVFGIAESEEFKNKGLSNAETVERMYMAMLGRASDPEGKQYWIDRLNAGMTITAIVNGFSCSAEFAGICEDYGIQPGSIEITNMRDKKYEITAFVSRCYTKALNRAFDVSGLEDWSGRLIRGDETPEQIANGFVFSEEMEKRGLSDSEFVDMLYALCFDRDSDEAGKNDWLGRMADGATREDVFKGFAGSEEFGNLVKSFGL